LKISDSICPKIIDVTDLRELRLSWKPSRKDLGNQKMGLLIGPRFTEYVPDWFGYVRSEFPAAQ
jgi:hypothetical protein